MPAARGADGWLDAGFLARRLDELIGGTGRWRLCVAFSGGRDSTVLLHSAAALRRRGGPALRALHVDHHLHEHSAVFRAHCLRVARSLRVPCSVLDVATSPRPGESVEAFARDARYRLLAEALGDGECLLTAQHADDQLETVLLQLLRGAGTAGLAAMPARMPLGRGLLLRPLLDVGGARIAAYAAAHGLESITDPTNESLRFDRNYLRARVLPALRERWPSAARSVGRSARHLAEADELLRRQSGRDLATAVDGEDLDLRALRRFEPARQRGVLRLWCTTRGAALPDERRLAEVQRAIDARPDATPLVEWSDVCLRRHGDRFVLSRRTGTAAAGSQAPARMARREPAEASAGVAPGSARTPGVTARWPWRVQPCLRLAGGGELVVEHSRSGEIDLGRLPPVLEVGARAGGERLVQPAGRRSVKKLLQELQVPPWRRAQVPLVWGETDGRRELLAVADLATAAFLRHDATQGGERGRFVWRPEG